MVEKVCRAEKCQKMSEKNDAKNFSRNRRYGILGSRVENDRKEYSRFTRQFPTTNEYDSNIVIFR